MIVRKTDQTYIRHVERESLLWNPRTSACYVIRDGEAFLRPLSGEFRAMEYVVSDVAQTFGENPDDVRKDVISFYADLVSQRFVECKATESNAFEEKVEEKTDGREINSSDEDGGAGSLLTISVSGTELLQIYTSTSLMPARSGVCIVMCRRDIRIFCRLNSLRRRWLSLGR